MDSSQARQLIKVFREKQRASVAVPGNIPGEVFQFWDRNIPDDVSRLLQRNQKKCADYGLGWTLFTDELAEHYLAEAWDEKVLAAYRLCHHPAMKADLFRMCRLYTHGGIYLDADMSFQSDPRPLLSLGRAVFSLAEGADRRGDVGSALLLSEPGCDVHRLLVDRAVQAVQQQSVSGATALGVMGPALITQVLAELLQGAEAEDLAGVSILSVAETYKIICASQTVLGRKVGYKSDARYRWFVSKQDKVDALQARVKEKPCRESYLELMRLLLSTNQFEEAVEWADRWAAAFPSDEAFFHQVRALYGAKRYRKAADVLDKAPGVIQSDTSRYPWASRIYAHADRLDQALHWANQGVGGGFDQDIWKAELLCRSEQYREAKKLLARLVAQHPDEALAWRFYATVLKALGESQQALLAIKRTIGLQPNDADFLCFAGELYKAVGMHKEAMACFSQAVRVRPGHRQSLRYLVHTEADLKRWVDPVSTLLQYCFFLGVVRRQQNRFASALFCQRQAIALNARDPEVRLELAYCHYLVGDTFSAWRLCRQLRANGFSSDALTFLHAQVRNPWQWAKAPYRKWRAYREASACTGIFG